jgi:4-hydroxy-tetrahydrodipicolinate synthase
MFRLVQGGALAEARALSRELAALSTALFAEPNPAVIKGVLARQGWLVDELRAPMLRASGDAVDRAEGLSRP